jgi:hypothetical protein
LEIEALLENKPELTFPEAFNACLYSVGDLLSSIPCHDCRRLIAKWLKKLLHKCIRDALIEGMKIHPDKTPHNAPLH